MFSLDARANAWAVVAPIAAAVAVRVVTPRLARTGIIPCDRVPTARQTAGKAGEKPLAAAAADAKEAT